MIPGLFFLLITLGLLPSPSIGAERIWDNDLKRFLTDQELMMADVYLREEEEEEEGVKIMFPQSERVRKGFIKLDPERKSLIEERIGWKFPEESFEVYIGESGTQIDGYAIGQRGQARGLALSMRTRRLTTWLNTLLSERNGQQLNHG